MKFLKTAVTGSAGSGKSIVRKKLAELGMAGFDCDEIAREIVRPGMPAFREITRLLGEKSVAPDGTLDRARVRRIIIDDSDMRKRVENILHPLILEELFLKMEDARSLGYTAAVAEVPLLFEMNLESRFDLTIAVVADHDTLLRRLVHRDGVEQDGAEKILKLQLDQKDKERRADVVIHNNAGREELYEAVVQVYGKIEKELLTSEP
ncbi:MAG: dephospho-CoA kinase [Desulfobacteraceae bacterium]